MNVIGQLLMYEMNDENRWFITVKHSDITVYVEQSNSVARPTFYPGDILTELFLKPKFRMHMIIFLKEADIFTCTSVH
jgi:hypothetical protein